MRNNSLDPIDEPSGRRWGCLLYSLSAATVMVTVMLIAYFVWYGNAKGELESEIARIVERGEPLWFADLEPKRPAPELSRPAKECMQATAR